MRRAEPGYGWAWNRHEEMAGTEAIFLIFLHFKLLGLPEEAISASLQNHVSNRNDSEILYLIETVEKFTNDNWRYGFFEHKEVILCSTELNNKAIHSEFRHAWQQSRALPALDRRRPAPPITVIMA